MFKFDMGDSSQSTQQENKPNYNWKDIKDEFFDCVEKLEVGELEMQDIFTLSESTSAVVMLDKASDIGHFEKKEDFPLSFKVAVETGQLKLKDFTYSELIGIFDSLFACLASWIQGTSIVQSILTCLYLHNTAAIEDKYLMSFCNGILKISRTISNFILRAGVYEEEDFQSNLFNFDLCDEIIARKVLAALRDSENSIQNCLRKLNSSDDEFKDLTAIISRIKYLRLMLQCLLELFPTRLVSPDESKMSDITKLLAGAIEVFPEIKKTIDRGTQPDPESHSPNPIGFSPNVNLRLIPPTFPRYPRIISRVDALNFLEELPKNIRLACKVIQFTNFQSVLSFFLEFSRIAEPCLLSRSVLQIIYFPAKGKVFGTLNLNEILKDSARDFIGPPGLLPRHQLFHDVQAKECIDLFFFNNGHIFARLIEVFGYYRSRQRYKIEELLTDFSNMQYEAEQVDAYCRKQFSSCTSADNCFESWSIYYSLRAMLHFLLLGFELELYSICEYFYIYWYMENVTLSWIISTLAQAEACLVEQKCSTEEFKNLSRGQKRTRLIKKMKPFDREMKIMQTLQSLCAGFCKAVGGFMKAGRIPKPLPEFDSEKFRYEHRFAAFVDFTAPQMISYQEFKENQEQIFTAGQEVLFLGSSHSFSQAKNILENLPNLDQELTSMLKVAKNNMVVMKLLANGHKKESKLTPNFDFSIHPCFPAIKQL
ncbi:CLUMA_CG010002, isoform A [Clunio marinus]|uniref:Protein MAK10 homolog n=1 Tax=Clunio marinus TaxID=568069 RepID=A0A1J1I8T9_9DIPT|nr:CLUMA_CG010002, isoform A [Clunio marinus]